MDIVSRLRRTRANMLGTADDAHFHDCHDAADEIERLRSALLDTARRVEALKRPCGMDPESPQALRNGEYMSIALTARAALTPNLNSTTPDVG